MCLLNIVRIIDVVYTTSARLVQIARLDHRNVVLSNRLELRNFALWIATTYVPTMMTVSHQMIVVMATIVVDVWVHVGLAQIVLMVNFVAIQTKNVLIDQTALQKLAW